jgi:hypothetical protein
MRLIKLKCEMKQKLQSRESKYLEGAAHARRQGSGQCQVESGGDEEREGGKGGTGWEEKSV